MPVPKEVKLKPKAEFRLIGTSQPRLDTPGKVDGSAEFGLDVKLPGMLYAALAQSPSLGGKAASVDSVGGRADAGRAPRAVHGQRGGRGGGAFLAGTARHAMH